MGLANRLVAAGEGAAPRRWRWRTRSRPVPRPRCAATGCRHTSSGRCRSTTRSRTNTATGWRRSRPARCSKDSAATPPVRGGRARRSHRRIHVEPRAGELRRRSSPGFGPPAASSPRTRRGCWSPRRATPAELAAMVDRRAAGLPARARPRLGGVLRPADRRGPRGLRAPPPHRVPRPRRPPSARRGRASRRRRSVLRLGRGGRRAGRGPGRGRAARRRHRPRRGALRPPQPRRRRRSGVRGRPRTSRCPPTLRGRVDVLVANAPYVPTEAIGLLPAGGPHARAAGGARRRRGRARRPAPGRRRGAAAGWRRAATCWSRRATARPPRTVAVVARNGLIARVASSDGARHATVVIGTSRPSPLRPASAQARPRARGRPRSARPPARAADRCSRPSGAKTVASTVTESASPAFASSRRRCGRRSRSSGSAGPRAAAARPGRRAGPCRRRSARRRSAAAARGCARRRLGGADRVTRASRRRRLSLERRLAERDRRARPGSASAPTTRRSRARSPARGCGSSASRARRARHRRSAPVGAGTRSSKQHVGLLLAAPRAAADQLLELGVHEHVAEPDRVAARSRAAPSAATSSLRVRASPPASSRGDHPVAALERRAVEPEPACTSSRFARWTRGAVSRSSQRMSSAATKCQVGRITWVRMISPSVNARSTSASVGAPADPLGRATT